MVAPLLAAQDQPSLAEAAKKNQDPNKPKSKIVINEETLTSQKGPLPDIQFEGPANSAQIIAAIRQYSGKHSAAETETALREWFMYFDDRMVQAMREDNEIRERKYERYHSIRVYSSRYGEYEQQRISDAYGDVQDQRAMEKNGNIIGRTRTVLTDVRNGIALFGLKYDWMKIHNNAVETF